jgi:uncharacterized membrane protein
MLKTLRSAVIHALVVTLVAMGMSRAVVSADVGPIRVHHLGTPSNSTSHAHHEHAHDKTDLGTWECLKHCVDGAADGTVVMSTILSKTPQSADYLIDAVKKSISEPVINTVLGASSPRGPPFLAMSLARISGQDIIFRTGRIRI